MGSEQLVRMFHEGTVYSFERAKERSTATFGGPLEFDFAGVPMGARPLHVLARLSLQQIPELWKVFSLAELPLIYGINYDGCEITYRIVPTGRIEILELQPSVVSQDC